MDSFGMLFADVFISNPIMQMLFLNIFLILYYMFYKFQTMKTKFNLLVCQNLTSAISFQLGQKSHSKLWNNISWVTFAFSSATQNYASSLLCKGFITWCSSLSCPWPWIYKSHNFIGKRILYQRKCRHQKH